MGSKLSFKGIPRFGGPPVDAAAALLNEKRSVEPGQEGLEACLQQIGPQAGQLVARGIGAGLLQHTRERATARREQLRPRQRLGARVFLEHVGIAPGARAVAGYEHRLDRVSVEPKMVVANRAAAKQFLPLGQQTPALGARASRASQPALHSRPAELHPDLAADRQCLAQRSERLRAATAVEQKARAHFQVLGFEATRAQLTNEPHLALEMK